MLGSMQRRTDKCVIQSTEESCLIYNPTKDSDWETLAPCRTIARLWTTFKACSVKRAWKAIRDRLRKPYYLSRVDHVLKFRDRKQRTDIGKYFFVNGTIKNRNQLPADFPLCAVVSLKPGHMDCVRDFVSMLNLFSLPSPPKYYLFLKRIPYQSLWSYPWNRPLVNNWESQSLTAANIP